MTDNDAGVSSIYESMSHESMSQWVNELVQLIKP